jgi:lysophospholipase L1-like esterase
MIYLIGDSHVSVFSGADKTHDGLRHMQPEFGSCYTLKEGQIKEKVNRFEQKIPYFCAVRIGAHTAFNSYTKIEKIKEVIEQYKITQNNYVFLSFGEIDIRHHIGYIADRNSESYEKTIKTCIENYLNTIRSVKTIHPKLGVYGPIASADAPGYGNVLTRNKMTLLFNEILRKECDNEYVLYRDITKKMILSNGLTDQKYIMDDIHLGQSAIHLIIEEFHDIIECDQHGKKQVSI